MTDGRRVSQALYAMLLLGCWVEVTNKNEALEEVIERATDDGDYLVGPDSASRPEQYAERNPLPFGTTRLAQEAAIRHYVPRVRSVRVDHGVISTLVYASNLEGGSLTNDVRDDILRIVNEHCAAGVGAQVLPMSAAPTGIRPRLSLEDAVTAMLHCPTVPDTQRLLRRLFPDLEIRCVLRQHYPTGASTLQAYVKGSLDSATHERLCNLLPELLTPGFQLLGVEHVQEIPSLRPNRTEDEYVSVV